MFILVTIVSNALGYITPYFFKLFVDNLEGLNYEYLLVKKIPEGGNSLLGSSLKLLLDSARSSNQYEIIRETENAVIFIKK